MTLSAIGEAEYGDEITRPALARKCKAAIRVGSDIMARLANVVRVGSGVGKVEEEGMRIQDGPRRGEARDQRQGLASEWMMGWRWRWRWDDSVYDPR